ncbi:HAD family hydrolase [Dyella sp. EPa41]|uniref:D-glycero-alpha-D-manno-heptose-1,7-bisphosphate 7-phosphatase n=1 Tax=Dyella sp. EPa41 TaxID=1561194 RepID=UPI00191675C0|nr:HAD family hydrolase [Dyella sp. EPa41]
MTDARKKALFLDRDGVINVDYGYVCSAERTVFIDGIFDLCRAAEAHGFIIVIVTNQAGIARGYYSEEDFHAYMTWMSDEFAKCGVKLSRVYHCPHHPSEGIGRYRVDCDCRKPMPGMILRAAEDEGVDLARSIFIGDKMSDMKAGRSAGVGNLWLYGQDDSVDGRADIVPLHTLEQGRQLLENL